MERKLNESVSSLKSINMLRNINKNIEERKFHDFTYILHDIRSILGKKKKTYMEIGSYVGSSASLMISHDYPTEVICIDPCNLDKSHYNGLNDQYTTLEKNISNHNNNNSFKIIQNYSTEIDIIHDYINNIKVDILFIDGAHDYTTVVNDFNNYEKYVNKNGFIVFDDYYDDLYSPEVRPAVDYIVSNLDKSRYDIIGTLDNIHSISANSTDYLHPKFINEFIIYKKY
jgi:predicted O-methyltransferase YrrM